MTREELDRLTFDTYVNVNLNATEAARQLGITRQTVKARVRRHSLRLATKSVNTTEEAGSDGR